VEYSQKKSVSAHCHSCGREQLRAEERKPNLTATTYQVVVACASCRTVFAALSRN
jgi:hypothetical protein